MSRHPFLEQLEAAGWQTEAGRPAGTASSSLEEGKPVSDEVANRYGNAALDRATRAVATAINGTRNHTLNREAHGLGRIAYACGIPEQLIVDELATAARTAGLDDKEIGTVLPRAVRDGMAEPRQIPDRTEEVPPAAVIDPQQTGIVIRDGAWLDSQVFPPMKWVIPGLVPEGMTLLVGSPKVGKSWLVLALSLGLARGGHAFGTISLGPPRPVLYLALEDGDRRLQDRCRKLLGDDPIPPAFKYVTRGRPIELLDAVHHWLDQHRDQAPAVIVDTFAKIRPTSTPGESAYERDYRHAGALKNLIDPIVGGGLIVVHHTNKRGGEGDFVDSVSGTQGIAGAADTTIVLNRKRTDDDGVLSVTGRDVLEGEYRVVNENGQWALDGGSLEAAAGAAREGRATRNLGDDAAAIVKFATDKGPVTPKQVELATGLPGSTVRSYLTRAVDAGRLKKHGRGKYGPVATATSATTVESDPTKVAHVAQATDPLNVIPFDRSTE